MAGLQLKELEDLYDKKISGCLESARAFCEERNSHCSVTKNLPAEVLSTIFARLASICKSKVQKHSHLRWTMVTHVCRVWRNAALKEPTLWIDFTDVHPNWIREMFARSMPFDPAIRQEYKLIRRIRLRFPACNRVSRANQGVQEISVKDSFLDVLVKPAPFLEALSTGMVVEFPPNFLAGFSPRLQSLTCDGDLPLEAPWLGNLTRLVYQGSLYPTATYLSKLTFLELDWDWVDEYSRSEHNIDIILSALENMPLLQHLSLSLSSHVGDVLGSRSTPVHLPHLCHISVFLAQRVRLQYSIISK